MMPQKEMANYIRRKSFPPENEPSLQIIKRKIKIQSNNEEDRTLSLDTLPQADDEEGINETQLAGQEIPREDAMTLSQDLTFIRTMNKEELNNHIQKCLEMSTENKITPKNAFALQLIDCMNFYKKDDFSVMACTLDAGQKIYAYRVDGLHQQVLKLAEEIVNNQKNKNRETKEGDESEQLKNEKRKASKKNILSQPETLKRTLKIKDPKEKFMKFDGLAGAIMSSVRRDPKDLSFTMQNSVQFWPKWENYKPVTVDGTVTIPQCEIYRDKNEAREKHSLQTFSPKQEQKLIVESDTWNSCKSVEESLDDVPMDDIFLDDDPIDEAGEGSDDDKSVEEDVDVISTALKRLNDEAEKNKDICTIPSRFEAMKIIFNQVSDYHYLNMEKAYYWAGPEFWKRPKFASEHCKDKKITRKKKEPNAICYTGPEAEEKIQKIMKKGSKLNQKTITGWKSKHVTYAADLKIGVQQFLDLFHMSGFFEVGESTPSSEGEMSIVESETFYDCDSFQCTGNASSDSSNSQDPLNSSFYEIAPENCESPEQIDPLNSAFYDAGLTQQSNSGALDSKNKIIKVQFTNTDNNSDAADNSDSALVPVPKIVNYQPIKYKSKPIRVDMQHLKQTMWEIINENIEKNEGEYTMNNLVVPSPQTNFSDVLRQLPSRLEKRTAEDLFSGMALLALLTLANENNLQLKNLEGNSDIVISFENSKHDT